MIQDLDFGRMRNEFHNDIEPQAGDTVVCFSGSKVLHKHTAEGGIELPTYAQVLEWMKENGSTVWREEDVIRYVFQLQDRNYFIFMGDFGSCPDEDFIYVPMMAIRRDWPEIPKNIYFGMCTAWHLYVWYRDNKYCGRCGAKTQHDGKERMMKCPECGNMIFPRINPAVIVIVTDGDKCLLATSAGPTTTSKDKRYGAIAGFIEIGETAEEAVAREVMEEVGLHVKNIRYYKSQPWGIAGNLSIGYFCDLDGDKTMHIDTSELATAEWFKRGEIPGKDDGISLTREMMTLFNEGREPR